MTKQKCQIVVGENGRRSGLAIAKVQDVELRVLVLPKVWREKGDVPWVWVQHHRHTCCVSVLCWETSRIALESIDIGQRSELLPQCVEAIEARSQDMIEDDGDREADEDDAERDSERDASYDDEATSENGSRPYATLVRNFAGSRRVETPTTRRDDDGDFKKAWEHFYGLWFYSQPYRRSRKRRKASWDDLQRAMSDVSGDVATTPLLAPFLHEMYVRHVEQCLGHIRPGYRRQASTSPFIRGRLHAVSAAMVAHGVTAACVCTYDAFGLDTPIQQVLLAALHVVSEYHGDLPQIPSTQATARWLSGFLQTVTRVPAFHALQLGNSLVGRLSKADGMWEAPLQLACLVLHGQQALSPVAGRLKSPFGWNDNVGSAAFVFDINTDHVWENVVRDAWPDLVDKDDKAEVVHPWKLESGDTVGRGMQADGVCETTEWWEIFDAKYSLPERSALAKTPARRKSKTGIRRRKRKRLGEAGPRLPSAAEQRQMYTYAATYAKGAFCRCYLVYPKTDSSMTEAETLFACDNRYQLKQLRIAFPSRTDVTCKHAWLQRLEDMRMEIRNIIRS